MQYLNRLQKLRNEIDDIKERIELAIAEEIERKGYCRVKLGQWGVCEITHFYFSEYVFYYTTKDRTKGYISLFEIEGIE